MAVVLNNIYNFASQYGERGGNIVYTIGSKNILTYGGNHLTFVS
jgi:hypothetical protein